MKYLTKHKKHALITALISAYTLISSPTYADPSHYSIEQIGLTGSNYVSQNGTSVNGINYMSSNGQVTGYTNRYNNADNTQYGRDSWFYNGSSTIQIGLQNSPFLSQNGTRYSAVNNMQNNFATGYSKIYNTGGNTELGRAAWHYNGTSSVEIGLNGAGYTSLSGYRFSDTLSLSDNGKAVGYSKRYDANSDSNKGQASWIYSGATTTQIGLFGAGYTSSANYAYSNITSINNSAQVIGNSDRYTNAGSSFSGTDAWIYNGSSSVKIGLTGYTSKDGFSENKVWLLSNNGHAAGETKLYESAWNQNISNNGIAAWSYDGSTSVRIGLVGNGYRMTDSSISGVSRVKLINTSGKIAGVSNRYSNTYPYEGLGTDTWLYDGNTTTKIGLSGALYTNDNGQAENDVAAINDSGQVVGNSSRFKAGDTEFSYGKDVWIFNGASTSKIGLSDVGHKSQDGTVYSNATKLNNAGFVAGQIDRYNINSLSGNTQGKDAWLFNGTSTVQIGLTGSGYTSNTGSANSLIFDMNDSGQVAGSSSRYIPGTNTGNGLDAWFYDPTLNQTFAISGSIRPSDNYAYSTIQYLGNDGLALGYYTLFDQATNANLGNRAFAFNLADGMWDLGSLVDDLTLEGWISLSSAIKANGLGNIAGLGKLSGQPNVTAAYILKPSAVPVPSTAWLLGSALLGVVSIKRRKR